MKKAVLFIFFVITALATTATAQALSQESVVRVSTTFQEYHPFMPWLKIAPDRRSGFGVVIDNTHVLTTESLIRNHTLIEIQRAHSGEKITASLVMSDPQVDLALLRVSNTNAFAGMAYAKLGTYPGVGSRISISQIDQTSGIQRGDGLIVKALVSSLPMAPSSALMYDVLTDLNVDGNGAPVIQNGCLAGIILSYSRTSRTGKMLPPIYISRFIEDVMDGSYSGVASGGFSWKPLIDPTKRAYLGVKSEPGGVQILFCLPGSGASVTLKPNDVILKWDGYQIDKLGYYEDEDYGRLLFPHLIKGRRAPGETVPVTIVRNGETNNVEVTLKRSEEKHDLIPLNLTDDPVPYLVEGGLVIRELNGSLLQAYGPNWQTRANSRLVHLFLTKQFSPEQPGDRIVLLSNVLPDPINISYQAFRFQIIEKVNGKPIRNIKDIFRIRKADGIIHTLSLRGVGVDIVLDHNQLPIANQRIANQYGIPSLMRTN